MTTRLLCGSAFILLGILSWPLTDDALIPVIMPAVGIAVGALFQWRKSAIPWLAVGFLVIMSWHFYPRLPGGWQSALFILLISSFYLTQSLMAYRLLKPLIYSHPISFTERLIGFLSVTATTATLNGLACTATLYFAGYHLNPPHYFMSQWLSWTMSDFCALLLFTPITLWLLDKKISNWKQWMIMLPIACLALVFLWIHQHFQQINDNEQKKQLQQQVQLLEQQLKALYSRHITLLETLDIYLSTQEHERDPAKFNQFSKSLTALPAGLSALGWAPYVEVDQIDTFIKQQQHVVNFKIKNVQQNSTEHQHELYPLTMIQPMFKHRHLIGLNLQSLNGINNTISQAIDHHAIALSPPQILSDQQPDPSLLMMHRVSQGNYAPGIIIAIINIKQLLSEYAHPQFNAELTPLDTRTRLTQTTLSDTSANQIIHFGKQPLVITVQARNPQIFHRPDATLLLPIAIFSLLIILIYALPGCRAFFLNYGRHASARPTIHKKTEINHIFFNKASTALIIVDHRGMIHKANERALNMLQYQAEELIHQPIEILVPDELKEQHKKFTMSYLNNPYSRNRGDQLLNIKARRKNNTLFDADIGLSPVHVDGHLFVIVSLIDSTHWHRLEKKHAYIQKEIEEQVQQNTKELLLAKNKAEQDAQQRNAFLADMSHEIRTPLSGVLGLIDVIKAHNQDKSIHHLLENMEISSRLLIRIINQILDLSKIESDKMEICSEPLNLSMLVLHLKELFEPRTTSKGLQFNIHQAPNLHEWVIGDFFRLTQILLNLLSNALKFTNHGSITLSIMQQAQNTIFKVSDTGIGMTQSQQEHLFNPYQQASQTTAKQYGGTGLGLAISQRLIKLMHGNITVFSRINIGTTMEVTLALPQTSAPAKPNSLHHPLIESNNQPAKNQLQGLTILAAEDDQINQIVIKELLQIQGAHCLSAANGVEALKILKSAEGKMIDLVLTDIEMPLMDGYQLATTIKKQQPALPVIGLTAHTMMEAQEQCLQHGMAAHISKPVRTDQLVATIHQCLPQADHS